MEIKTQNKDQLTQKYEAIDVITDNSFLAYKVPKEVIAFQMM